MTKLKVLSASTALVLGFALASPTVSLAQQGRGRGGGVAGGHVAGGGAAIGAGGGHMGGPGMAGRGANFGRMGGGPATAPAVGGRGAGPIAATAPTGRLGGGGTTAWRGGDRDWHQRGWWPGAAFVAGAGLGAGLGSYAYSGGPDYYYDDTYYDYGPDYGDIGVVEPAPVGVDSSYCAQRFRSYDPATGTYLGYDGQRHPCP